MFRTKYGDADEWLTEIVDEVERTRLEQRVEPQVDLKMLSPLVWEGLIFWHQIEAAMAVENQMRINELFEALLASKM